jgi:hypothetical protein
MVVCRYDTQLGEVTELTDDMILFELGPLSNSFRYDVTRAYSGEVLQRISDRRRLELYRQEAAANRRDAEQFLVALTNAARRRVELRNNQALSLPLEAKTHLGSGERCTLEELMLICRKLGITIRELVLDIDS